MKSSFIGLAFALIVWSALAWYFVVAGSGTYVCSILQPVAVAGQPTPSPLTQAELEHQTRQRCGPHNEGAIIVFGLGYVLIIGGFAVYAARSREVPVD